MSPLLINPKLVFTFFAFTKLIHAYCCLLECVRPILRIHSCLWLSFFPFSHMWLLVWYGISPLSLTHRRRPRTEVPTERTELTGCDARRFPINSGQGLSLFAFFSKSTMDDGDIRSFVIGRCSVLCMHCVSVSWSLNRRQRRRHVMITITGTSASVSATVEKELVLHPEPAERMGTCLVHRWWRWDDNLAEVGWGSRTVSIGKF